MEQNSSSQMGRFCSQWLLEIRFPCRDSENSSDYGSKNILKNSLEIEKKPSWSDYTRSKWLTLAVS